MTTLALRTRIFLHLALILGCLSACNLAPPAPLLTPTPEPAMPQARIRFPAHNQQVTQDLIFDIEIQASDSVMGVQRVELYVDEQLLQTSESESGGVADYRVIMNWFAKETGWHKFAAVAYRADGTASHPHIIALEVIPRQAPAPPTASQGEA